MSARRVQVVTVFADGPGGGNPAPVVLDADGMTDDDMRAVAAEHGHESAFVLPAAPGSDGDVHMRYWVPRHEMSMCGHATVGATWLLARDGRIAPDAHLRVATASGTVECRVSGPAADPAVEVSQPAGRVEAVDAPALVDAVRDVLGLRPDELAGPVRNAATSRVKTLVPLRDPATLDALVPRWAAVERLCDDLGSTGLYPWAVADATERVIDARQFPRSSGYPEDPATGIAAAALAWAVVTEGPFTAGTDPVTVRQGRAMGRPSRITVRHELRTGRPGRSWVGGPVHLTD